MHDIHVIDPVSRIEGHAKITLHLGADGEVADARFHVTEFRGFEEFCRGRTVDEMPGLTARTCGICPVSHLLASAKAGDAIGAVTIPPAAVLQRQLANLGQIVQSHALSFFHLSAPDLLLGMEADPATRNVFGLMEREPEVVRRGIRLRQFGQELIFTHDGRPFFHYFARAWIVDDQGEKVRDAALETGFLRCRPEGQVELVMAHHTGFVEIWYGEAGGGKLELWRDMARSVEAIRRLSARDAERWPDFCGRMTRLARLLEALYSAPPPDPMTGTLPGLARLALFGFVLSFIL